MLFFVFLLLIFGVSLVTSFIVVKFLRPSIQSILTRLSDENIALSWTRYLLFAIYVAGISGGVNIWRIEDYFIANNKLLTSEKMVLDVYSTIISTLHSISWILLVFFVSTFIAYVIVKRYEKPKI